MPRRSKFVLAALITLSIAGAAPAQAAITTSAVNTPANGFTTSMTTTPPPQITFSGTSNGASGDPAELRCYERADDWTHIASITVGSGGAWSHTAPPGTNPNFFPLSPPCRVRLVAGGDSDLSDNTGPLIAVEQRRTTSAGGIDTDFLLAHTEDRGYVDALSVSSCGLCDMALFDPSTTSRSNWLFFGNAALYDDEASNFPPAPRRSYIQIDGNNAYAPYAATSRFPANGGRPALSASFAIDAPATTRLAGPEPRDMTITTTEPFVRCPSETPFPPTAGSCPSYQATGVTLERTLRISNGGTRVLVTDVWRSTDGGAHQLDLHYDNYQNAPGTTVPVYRFPWVDADFVSRATGAQVGAPPSAPASVFIKSNKAAGDNDPDWPVGSITFGAAPDGFVFGAQSDSDFIARFARTVPAGGTTAILQEYNMARTLADVQASASAAEDQMSPPTVAITSPADASTVTSPALTLTGTAADNKGVTLKVDGQTVAVAADGTWSAPKQLALGANTFKAVATDAAGNVAQAQVTVAYKDVAAPGLGRLSATRRTFAVGTAPTAISARAAKKKAKATKKGTTFAFTLTEAATASLRIEAIKAGRRKGKKCAKPTRKLRKHKACKRYVAAGVLQRKSAAGANRVAFSGRVGKRKLKPGRYRLTVTAVDPSGNVSKKATLTFRIVRR